MVLRKNTVLIKLQTKGEFVIKGPVLPFGNMANGPSVHRLAVLEYGAKGEFVQKMANGAPGAMNLNV